MFGVRRVRPCFDGDESLVADFTQTRHHSAPIDITVEKRNELPLTSARGQFEILEMDPPDASAKHEDPIFRITELQNISCVKMHAHCVAVELIDKGTHIPGTYKKPIPDVFGRNYETGALRVGDNAAERCCRCLPGLIMRQLHSRTSAEDAGS